MNFLKTLTGADILQKEKSRLEAFLAAFPGEYCGFSKDGIIAYSKNFCELLNITSITDIHNIQNALNISDSAILEGLFIDLKENQKHFTINAQTTDAKTTLRISGTIGEALNGLDQFYIIWLEDITEQHGSFKTLEKSRDFLESEVLRLQKTLDLTPIPLWMRDNNTDIIWCNKAYANILGETPASIVTKQIELSLSSKSKIKNIKEIAKKAIDTGIEQKIKSYIVALGKRYFMEVSEKPLPGTNFIIGLAQDLTKSEEQDSEMKRYLSANNALLEQLRSAVAIYGDDQKLEFYNSSFSMLWNLDEQWLNNKPTLSDVLEKLRETRNLPEQADFKAYKQSWIDMFTRLIDPHEDMMYLPNSTAIRFLVMPHPMGGLMMVFEDVTNHLELESSYNTLIAVQKETLDNLSEGVAVFGSDGRLKLCNPSYADIWGLNPEDLKNEPHITKLVERMKNYYKNDNWEQQKQQIISQAIDRSIKEGRLELTNGILLDYTTVPLPDGGVLISYFDVTDTVKVEKALRDRNAALEAAEQLKTDFIANVSYQLRTPLNAIMGFAEILDNQYFGDLNEKQKEYTGDIKEAGEKLVHLIDDILDLSTIEAGYLDLIGSEINIFDMLSNIYELTNSWARKQNLSITIKCEENIKNIVADHNRIKQVILNLIRNAINFTPSGGEITIGAIEQDSFLEIYVSDNGVGISKKDQDRIFNPFERIHKERIDMSPNALEKGAGLGLSLVKNIVELHGGHVKIDSNEGQGTTFKIYLPIETELETIY